MKIEVLDTTLRDGEQTPGISLNTIKKLRIATKLDEIGVNSIEAGSAITSEGEREAIKAITSQGLNAEIVSFSRTLIKDVDYCLECDVDAVNIVVPTSDLHLQYKLKKTQDEMLEDAVKVTEYAKDHGVKVELAAEDSTRTDIQYLRKIFKATIDAGADRICPCDTLGILTPLKSFNFYKQFTDLGVPVSAHCHNDFGLAVANTLSAIDGGASRFHATINGLGERAGNAALEEVVVSLYTLYKDESNERKYETDIKIDQIYSTSKLVSRLSNAYLAPNKPIVGENAFAHESGIHADGVIKNSATYEPIMPELVGHRRKFVIGKHVGTKGLNNRLEELGLEVNKKQLNDIFYKVKDLGDKGKTVTDTDLEAIAEHVLNIEQEKKINLDELTIVSGNKIRPTASIKLNIENEEVIEADVGIGPVDAAINAVNKGIKSFADIQLEEYHVDAVTGGTDALIEVIIKLSSGDKIISARATEPDIINASVEAYIDGVNRLLENK
ncbi:citramalate synthase CimA [Methanobrevibacter ruminantium M1]|uniref:Putative (R)-citramalate synthase CimA n=1 Tax=Methanobrevibacter ruminantium (strain ATCC 35063 / DSM 1093 / JCM 13430 / OCM 146 / M1) TaxID=634498 RepID=D3E403_METRM|nr:(R)-citramalate synthase [Methanobrevibacter ruminantium]ADC47264.1 citramalate synthase CimA [Methanobrevibacter ruminantium M1]